MKDFYREVFEHMRAATLATQEAHRLLVEASQSQQRAGESMMAAFTAALAAKEEHEDLRTTVERLEQLVMEQSRDLRALRERLEGGGR